MSEINIGLWQIHPGIDGVRLAGPGVDGLRAPGGFVRRGGTVVAPAFYAWFVVDRTCRVRYYDEDNFAVCHIEVDVHDDLPVVTRATAKGGYVTYESCGLTRRVPGGLHLGYEADDMRVFKRVIAMVVKLRALGLPRTLEIELVKMLEY